MVWWALVIGLGLLTATAISATMSDAAAARAAWGDTQPVAVATGGVGVGELLSTRVEWVEYPIAVIPDSAATDLPADSVARTAVTAGEIIVLGDIVPEGRSLAASLPPNTVALAVPIGAGSPPLAVGDHVDLLAPRTQLDESARLAEGVVVVGVEERAITVAVANADAAAVAHAVTRSDIVAALVPLEDASE